MSEFLDLKFIDLIAGDLRNFKRKSDTTYNFSCPICGDSEKKKYKARGYLYIIDGNAFYKCYNCNISMKFISFIKEVQPTLYERYTLEAFQERDGYERPRKKKPVIVERQPVWLNPFIQSVLDLKDGHSAISYLKNRKIPENRMGLFYWVSCCHSWANATFNHAKFKDLPVNDSRIVLPVFDRKGVFVKAICRTLDINKEPRYLSCTTKKERTIFGIDRWTVKEKTYIVEGPIDSLFLPNCVAAESTDLIGVLNILLEMGADLSKCVLVFDNEPRNEQLYSVMSNFVGHKFNICIWPKSIKQKDVNEMIMSGIDAKEIIDDNTYSGLESLVVFNNWRK